MVISDAVITGAASGIGRHITGELLRLGINALALDTDEVGLRRFAASMEGVPGTCQIAAVDVSDFSAVERAVEEASFGSSSGLAAICCAGILRFGEFTDLSEEDWQATLKVNVLGSVSTCRAVVPAMRAAKRGRIVCVSSWFGKTGRPNFSAYCASKFAIIGMVQSLALELAKDGVLVNAICPGTIAETGMRDVADRHARRVGLPTAAERAAQIPLGRAGMPADVWNVIEFLLSDRASYMTGQAINVTGGLFMS